IVATACAAFRTPAASSTRTGCSSRRAISRCSRGSIPTAPHLARMLGFQRALPQLFASAMLGGMMLVSADWASRMLIFPWQIPAGLLAALVGGPYFMVLMWKGRQ
ncbi:MAG: hypothetical protein E5W90_32145, partial [Mesorhizobium sp.]